MGGWCSKRNVPTKGTACIQYSQQSSYFSAGCLVSETEYLAQIYGLYSPVSLSSYLFPSVKMGTYIMVSMVVSLIAAVLLVPTAYVLLGGRSSGAKAVVSLGKLFIPHINIGEFLYSPYGIGLAALVIIVLTAGLFVQQYQSDECCAKVLRAGYGQDEPRGGQ